MSSVLHCNQAERDWLLRILQKLRLTPLPSACRRDSNGFSRRADALWRRRSRAITSFYRLNPLQSEQCRTLLQCRIREGESFLCFCWELAHEQISTKTKTDDLRHPFCIVIKRRGRDSNPRSLAAQRFSRPPQSTTLPPLQGTKVEQIF